MKRALTLFLAACALMFGVAAASPASASTHHPAVQLIGTKAVSISNSTCPNEQSEYGIAIDGNWGRIYWTHNGCHWYERLHVHCAIPKLGLDYHWHDSGFVKSLNYNSDVHCPSNSFVITTYVQWKYTSSSSIHSRKVSSQT